MPARERERERADLFQIVHAETPKQNQLDRLDRKVKKC